MEDGYAVLLFDFRCHPDSSKGISFRTKTTFVIPTEARRFALRMVPLSGEPALSDRVMRGSRMGTCCCRYKSRTTDPSRVGFIRTRINPLLGMTFPMKSFFKIRNGSSRERGPVSKQQMTMPGCPTFVSRILRDRLGLLLLKIPQPIRCDSQVGGTGALARARSSRPFASFRD